MFDQSVFGPLLSTFQGSIVPLDTANSAVAADGVTLQSLQAAATQLQTNLNGAQAQLVEDMASFTAAKAALPAWLGALPDPSASVVPWDAGTYQSLTNGPAMAYAAVQADVANIAALTQQLGLANGAVGQAQNTLSQDQQTQANCLATFTNARIAMEQYMDANPNG